ncbi:MAG: hypothetical protein JW384_02726 [Nitrosomonadaceae bacterium]|nr:hypothetical protein [Nitrosomonadaceae bacterium]
MVMRVHNLEIGCAHHIFQGDFIGASPFFQHLLGHFEHRCDQLNIARVLVITSCVAAKQGPFEIEDDVGHILDDPFDRHVLMRNAFDPHR